MNEKEAIKMLEVATKAMQEAYNDLQEVFSQRQMLDKPVPEAARILRQALIEVQQKG